MISYYTDGSASPNPGPGGYAVIKDGQPYLVGGEPSGAETTNIRMEGLAIMAALQDAAGQPCQIQTDSEFWVKVLTEWAPRWQAAGWYKRGGIKNLDIVQPLFKLYQTSRAKLVWTRGHVGTELNELADQWANQARHEHLHQPTPVADLYLNNIL
jgi:ribonuclease HI